MTEPDTSGEKIPAGDPFKVLAVEKQGTRELLITVTGPDGTPRQLTVVATPRDSARAGLEHLATKYGTAVDINPCPVTGVLGAPGVPDEDPAEALPDPATMTLDELFDEATAQITRIEEEHPHA